MLQIEAANPGEWGNKIRVTVEASSKAKTQVIAVNGADLKLKNADGFNQGDVVELFDGKAKAYATIVSSLDNIVTLDAPCTLNVADEKIGTPKYIKTCELTLTVKLDDVVETYANVSPLPRSRQLRQRRARKSDLVTIAVTEAKAPAAPKEGKDEKAPAPPRLA